MHALGDRSVAVLVVFGEQIVGHVPLPMQMAPVLGHEYRIQKALAVLLGEVVHNGARLRTPRVCTRGASYVKSTRECCDNTGTFPATGIVSMFARLYGIVVHGQSSINNQGDLLIALEQTHPV